MSVIEIVLTCCAAVIPVASLIILAPKIFKKKEKAEKKEEQPKEEVKEKPAPTAEAKKPKEERIIDAKNYTAEDFKGYLQQKQAAITKPVRKFMEKDTSIPFDEFEDLDFDFEVPKKEKTIKEQIDALSPELKAILFTNALQKKKY